MMHGAVTRPLQILALITVPGLTSCDRQSDSTHVFRNDEHKVSFRYPSTWESVPPQLNGTLVLLNARDGSFATCNLSVRDADRTTVDQMGEAYCKTMLSKLYPDVALREVRFIDSINGKRVIVEYYFTLPTPSGRVPAASLTLIALQNGKRYMLIVNSKRERLEIVRPTFELMAGSLLFDVE